MVSQGYLTYSYRTWLVKSHARSKLSAYSPKQVEVEEVVPPGLVMWIRPLLAENISGAIKSFVVKRIPMYLSFSLSLIFRAKYLEILEVELDIITEGDPLVILI